MGFIQRLQGMQNLWENRKVGKESKKKKKTKILDSKIEALDLYGERKTEGFWRFWGKEFWDEMRKRWGGKQGKEMENGMIIKKESEKRLAADIVGFSYSLFHLFI